jgi:prepilin-type N-terminal cleavage/methylation domain-containing protein
MKRGFTLVELIIVVIIVGILASLGFTQYSAVVEKSRLAEARIRIGTMRQLAYAYYLNGGSTSAITNADVGVDNATCTSTGYWRYAVGAYASYVFLQAKRCTSGGKVPNSSSQFAYCLTYYPSTGAEYWCCHDEITNLPCYGLPHC